MRANETFRSFKLFFLIRWCEFAATGRLFSRQLCFKWGGWCRAENDETCQYKTDISKLHIFLPAWDFCLFVCTKHWTHTCMHTFGLIHLHTRTCVIIHSGSYSNSLLHAQMKTNTYTMRLSRWSFIIRVSMIVGLYYVTFTSCFNRKNKAIMSEFRYHNSTVRMYNFTYHIPDY